MIRKKPEGVVVPLVTPVTETGELDTRGLEQLIALQLRAGIHGLFVGGTTGEGPSIPARLRRKLISTAKSLVGARVPLYAGVFSNSVEELIALANEAFELGTDIVVLTAPNYFPASAPELRLWFRKTINHMKGPVVLYNIPQTTHVSIPIEIIDEFVSYPTVLGLKDSENNPQRLRTLLGKYAGHPQFSILVGVGALMYEGMELHADGIVPSAGNLHPELCVDFYNACINEQWTRARTLFESMTALAALYQKGRTLSQSLAALKAVLAGVGICSKYTLPPIVPADTHEVQQLHSEFRSLREQLPPPQSTNTVT